MRRPFNVLIRDVTCRTISTGDGNLNCCFVSDSTLEGGSPGRGGSGVHTCINTYEAYVSGVRHPVRSNAAHRTIRKGSSWWWRQFRTRCAPTLPESARFFLAPTSSSRGCSTANDLAQNSRDFSSLGCSEEGKGKKRFLLDGYRFSCGILKIRNRTR